MWIVGAAAKVARGGKKKFTIMMQLWLGARCAGLGSRYRRCDAAFGRACIPSVVGSPTPCGVMRDHCGVIAMCVLVDPYAVVETAGRYFDFSSSPGLLGGVGRWGHKPRGGWRRRRLLRGHAP